MTMNCPFSDFINKFYWEFIFEIIFLVFNPHCSTSMTHKWNPTLTNINHSTSLLSKRNFNDYWKHEYLVVKNFEPSNFTHEWNWQVIVYFSSFRIKFQWNFLQPFSSVTLRTFYKTLQTIYKPFARRYSVLRFTNL